MENKKYTFPDKLKENNGVLMVKIPSFIAKSLNLETGQEVDVTISKKSQEDIKIEN